MGTKTKKHFIVTIAITGRLDFSGFRDFLIEAPDKTTSIISALEEASERGKWQSSLVNVVPITAGEYKKLQLFRKNGTWYYD